MTVTERGLDPKDHPGIPPELLQPDAVVFTPPDSLLNLVDVSQWWRFVPGSDWRHPSGAGSCVGSACATPSSRLPPLARSGSQERPPEVAPERQAARAAADRPGAPPRAPDQGRHGHGLPGPGRIPPRRSLPEARRLVRAKQITHRPRRGLLPRAPSRLTRAAPPLHPAPAARSPRSSPTTPVPLTALRNPGEAQRD